MTCMNHIFNHKTPLDATKLFWLTFFTTFLLRCYFAYAVPITGDEAEYIYWAQHLAWGYYDHPPMIAWLLHPFIRISTESLWVRLPQILTMQGVAWAIFWLLGKDNKIKAALCAILFLLTPVALFDLGILTDTPLLLFTFLAVCLWYFVVRYEVGLAVKPTWVGWIKFALLYLLVGVLFGAAFWSKFLLFPVAIACFCYVIWARKCSQWWCLLFIFLGASPFFIQNIVWNYHHDWVNYLFNLDLRNEGATFVWKNPLKYVAILLYLYSPYLLYQCICHRKMLTTRLRQSVSWQLLMWVALFPMLFYALLSFKKSIGLHWIFCAYPFLFLLLSALPVIELKKCVRWMFIYSGFQVLLVVVLLYIPLRLVDHNHEAKRVHFFFDFPRVANYLQPYLSKGYVLATPSYAQSYLLSYQHHWNAAGWGVGSVHGRQDDLSSDFKKFNDRYFVIVYIDPKRYRYQQIAPFFRQIRTRRIIVDHQHYLFVFGYHFRYKQYRHVILQAIANRYYQMPDWLPVASHFYLNKYHLNV